MVKNFAESIQMVENKWLNSLYFQSKRIFSNQWIPSHDETHSFRAWTFAKELMGAMDDAGVEVSVSQMEQVIIAVFFHDTGMIDDPGPSHGLISRVNTEQYLATKPGLNPGNMKDLLEAVTHHDDKTYRFDPDLKTGTGLNISHILGAADDMDAFAGIGAYRFIEIYLIRHMPVQAIPDKAMSSLDDRFMHIEKNYGFLHAIVQKHKRRYQLARTFFEDMKQELSYGSGYAIHVLEIIRQSVLHDKNRPGSSDMWFRKKTQDPATIAFFKVIQREFISMHKNLPDPQHGHQ